MPGRRCTDTSRKIPVRPPQRCHLAVGATSTVGLASGPPGGRRAASTLDRATPTVCHMGQGPGQSSRRQYPGSDVGQTLWGGYGLVSRSPTGTLHGEHDGDGWFGRHSGQHRGHHAPHVPGRREQPRPGVRRTGTRAAGRRRDDVADPAVDRPPPRGHPAGPGLRGALRTTPEPQDSPALLAPRRAGRQAVVCRRPPGRSGRLRRPHTRRRTPGPDHPPPRPPAALAPTRPLVRAVHRHPTAGHGHAPGTRDSSTW